MSQRAKLVEKFRQNPKNVRYEDLETLLLNLGFHKRRGGGSHVVFSFPGREPFTIPVKRPFLKSEYVKMALRIIDELYLVDEDLST